MGYQIYRVGKRWGGYGVPAICVHPDCNEEIDREVSFACGGEPFSEFGCDRYFCEKHRYLECWKCDGSSDKCDHDITDKECECECKFVCERCRDGLEPFPYKPETKEWCKWVLKNKSWKEWREKEENKDEVEMMKNIINKK